MNKKIIPIAIASTLLVGCGSSAVNYSSEVENGSKTAINIDGTEISKNDIYHYLLEQFGSSEILSLALTYIADQEITDEDAFNTRLNEEIASQEESGTSLDDIAKQYGLENRQQYIDQVLSIGVKQQMLKEKYINKNYKKLVKEYKVKYLKTITLDTEAGAKKLLKEIKNGSDFDTVMNENSGSDVGMVTTETTTVDSNIIKKLDDFTKDGVHNKVIETSDSKYAIVYVYNTDTSEVEDGIKSNLSSISDMSTKMETYYLKQYNFDVHEDAIRDEIEETEPDYLG